MKDRSVSIGSLAIVAVLVMGSACSSHGTRLEFNGHELFYTDNVTEAEARNLGEYLVKIGLFAGDTARSVQLAKPGATYQVRLVMQPGTQDDLDLRRELRRLAGLISVGAFNRATTEIHTCDDQLKTCEVIN